ncbi:hypothetical protein RSAG8_09470, partial [Rhizoctonia solani AG-8 WAC10335]
MDPCISKIITSTRFELAHFVLVDILCSMAYGLPQVVDYETATLVPETEIHPIAWVHCCPLEFQVSIAEMNQRCAKSYVAPDWHVIDLLVHGLYAEFPLTTLGFSRRCDKPSSYSKSAKGRALPASTSCFNISSQEYVRIARSSGHSPVKDSQMHSTMSVGYYQAANSCRY